MGDAVFLAELRGNEGAAGLVVYTRPVVLKGQVRRRRETIAGADTMHVRLRGLGPHQILHITLMEDDGTSWSAAVPVDGSWSEQSLPLAAFTVGRGVLLPEGFPAEGGDWAGPAAEHGRRADRPR